MNDETSQGGRLQRLVGRLRNCAQAYPDDMFLPTTHEQRAEHGTLITQAAAAMGRHFSPLFTEAADEIERLRAERDAAFAMSKCECSAEECCANLVAKAQEIERLQYAESWIRARSAAYPTDAAEPGTWESGYAFALQQAVAAFCKPPNAGGEPPASWHSEQP